MHISRFQVGNYKSIHKPISLAFSQGFNIISGQNNAGKTALLEALSLAMVAKPHRSLKTVPARDSVPDQESSLEVGFSLTPAELKELMRAMGPTDFQLATPDPTTGFSREIGYTDHSVESVTRLLNFVFLQKTLTIDLRYDVRAAGRSSDWRVPHIPSYGLYHAQRASDGSQFIYNRFRMELDGSLTPIGAQFSGGPSDFGVQLVGSFQRHVYRFEAERMKMARGAHGQQTILAPNAVNLAGVLSQLQDNPSRYRLLNRRVSEILPQVKWVSVRGISHGEVEIFVWCHDPESQREDLAVPLVESGTGIGQVLAILYVVMTSERPQTIIIDEPQSFLHPGAARKLIEFLKLYPHHQFIIATHSPTIIAAANPRTITLARFEYSETILQQLDTNMEKGIQATMSELGIRLSDVFGADNILWVEGQTEEKCFPLIVEKILKKPLMGTAILGVRQTGDLEGRDAKRVFEIYRALSKGASLLPPALAFVLDDECRSQQAKKELFTLSDNLAQFLPVRMYENYILSAAGIAAVANSIKGFREKPLSLEEVSAALKIKLDDPTYYCSRAVEKTIATVDGALILERLFRELSANRVEYQKIRHGIALTDWLIENEPNQLTELASILSRILFPPS
jgi:energy-coupling factor transporter ATP-binding protein EcfA2